MNNNQKKVNLFIIGASKCGTTSLWHMLSLHPDICMSKLKEPSHFSFSDYNSEKKMDRYISLFKITGKEKYIGEASPIYSETVLIPEIPQRIFNYNKNAKIIYIVREPISRIKSVWRQNLSSGHWHTKKYNLYTDVDVPLMPKNIDDAIFSYPSFIDACKYSTILHDYIEVFPTSNILLLFFEDLKKNAKDTYSSICNFLNIPEIVFDETFDKKNLGNTKKRDYSILGYLKKTKLIRFISKIFNNLGIRIKFPMKKITNSVILKKNVEEEINNRLSEEKKEILLYGGKPINFWQ